MKAFLATLLTLACAGLASANVTVTGTGKVVYVPDIGWVTVGVSSDGKTANEAWQKNADVVKKLFAALKAQGIDPKDMKTSGLSIVPRYIHPEHQEPRLVGYTASYDLTVTVRKLDALGRVLDRLVENGANRNMSIRLGCADPDRLLDQARRKAAADARHKAELYVTGAGASLGQVVTISEGQVGPWNTFRYEQLAPAGDKGLPIAAGEQELSVSVTVVYAINQTAGPVWRSRPGSLLEDR